MSDIEILDETLGESGEMTLLALMDGASTPYEIGIVTGLPLKLIMARLHVLLDLLMVTSNLEGYFLTEEGLRLARVAASRRNSVESELTEPSAAQEGTKRIGLGSGRSQENRRAMSRRFIRAKE